MGKGRNPKEVWRGEKVYCVYLTDFEKNYMFDNYNVLCHMIGFIRTKRDIFTLKWPLKGKR